jgi:zinc protease
VTAGAALTAAPAALRLRVQRAPGVAVVAVRVAIAGGARVEAVPGRALVTGRLLSEGSRRRDHRELADRVEARGMLLHTGGSFESHGLALDALAGDWEEALDLAAELILEPAFAAERCAWVARQTAAELDSLADQPDVRTAWSFLDQLYAPHPRSRPLQGSAASLAALAPADCAAFHLASISRGLTVVVTGDVDEAAVEARARELFGVLPAAGEPQPEPPPPAGAGEDHRTVALPPEEGEDAGQAHLYAGHLTVRRADEDFDALALAAVVLGAGSGLTGRIPERIREREGLAYTASAATAAGAGLDPGRLVVYVGTSAATVEQAERGVREELARFVDEGPTEEEVADARAYLAGREPFRRETARQLADLIVRAEHYGLPLDRPGWREERLARLGRTDVHAAVRRHLHPDRLKVTVGLPAAP